MSSFILLFHIATMIISLIAMSLALGGVLMGHKTAVTFAKIGTVSALFGAAAGVYLLVLHSAALQCVVLTSYLALIGFTYRYLFAMGDVSKCGWVRER